MEPKIVKKEAFAVIGMPYLGKNEHGEIGELWAHFGPRMGEIQDLLPGESFGVCDMTPDGLIDYVAAMPVGQAEAVPDGMTARTIPANTYAVLPCKGLSQIGPTYQAIMEWMQANGKQRAAGPDFELYNEEFDPDRPMETTLYIYYPIIAAN
jgi:predicted transcriptional regulator YdeE